MLCNTCLNTCVKYYDIPCGHQACLTCTEDYINQGHTYQCPICLQKYQLEKQPKKIEPPQPITSMLLYCIQCEEAFDFEQMRAGMHRAHTFDHLEKFLPLIRERTMQKLNKGLVIESALLVSAQEQRDEEYLTKIRTLNNEIKSFFQQEKQILLQMQQKLLDQVALLEERTVIFLQKRRQQLSGLYRQIHRINQTLQEFINSDRTKFKSCDILALLQQPFQLQFLDRIKQVERQTVEIPTFYPPNTILSVDDPHVFLKYPEAALSESTSSQLPERSPPRRVNLTSKIARKLNCL